MTFIPGVRPPSADAARSASQSASRSTQWFAVAKRGLVVVKGDGGSVRLPTEDELRACGLAAEGAHFLGQKDDAHVFAIEYAEDRPLPEGWLALGIRGLVDAFDEETFSLAGRATHVLDWATTHRFCGRCGTATERADAERCMRCPKCTLSVYPRIAPAVIVLVRRGDEALLARNARFPLPFFSTLAGFSDVGEALEDTVHREIHEEVGVRVRDVRYFGSQPWPFPNSLMIGFTAQWESGDIVVDEDEIAEAAWFRAEALPMVPPPMSIARRLIDAWVAEVTRGK